MERNTTAYQLNILRDTQMVQRRLLEKQFPYIDWTRMPFSSYGDFFRLRGILDDCGAVWTNAYGRSNSEAESTRKYLEDYSGNGRDIELFNFGYSGQSGFNGYVQDFRPAFDHSSEVQFGESSFTMPTNQSTLTWKLMYNISAYNNKEWKLKVHLTGKGSAGIVFYHDDVVDKSIYFTEGINVIPKLTEISASTHFAYFVDNGSGMSVEQIAPYQGALVSDGVDDYGQCVKDFSLPDDYTVVAMREILNDAGCLISKSISNSGQAFILENIDTDGSKAAWSFGNFINVSTLPKLFSWLTKTSYNGNEFAPGTKKDSTDLPLTVFLEGGNSKYMSAALYSFGIFTRTLTEDELRIVENCMYAEWIAMTGKLEDIEYYDILDARFRSNEEDADKRNKWVGRLGKLHMTLNNYGYSQMSGWNGYPTNWENWDSDIQKQGGTIIKKQNKVTVLNFGTQPTWQILASHDSSMPEMKVRIRGLKDGCTVEFNKTGSAYATFSKDGVYTVPADNSAPQFYGILSHGYGVGESAELTIELLPDYGGALVSDGVDDYAVSDEVIDEPIGGFVCHVEAIQDSLSDSYVFDSGPQSNNPPRIWVYKGINGFSLGAPEQSLSNLGSLSFSREPGEEVGDTLKISKSIYGDGYGNFILYQLRLIKTQPTETQLEAIKWQCRKEHYDYLIHMGWKEVE